MEENKQTKFRYFKIGEVNPISGRSIVVGKNAFAKLIAKFGEKELYKHIKLGKWVEAIENAQRKYKYFEIGNEIKNPITGRIATVGKPTFSKLVKQFK
jgi:hypothetical protein